jgi:tetratricopeptide (TPR) repeat protein
MSKEKQWVKAIEFFEIAHKYDQLIENTNGLADDVYAMGVAYDNLGDTEMALSCYIRARDMYDIINDKEMSSVAEKKIKNILE